MFTSSSGHTYAQTHTLNQPFTHFLFLCPTLIIYTDPFTTLVLFSHVQRSLKFPSLIGNFSFFLLLAQLTFFKITSLIFFFVCLRFKPDEARDILGYRPLVGPDVGLKRMVDHFKVKIFFVFFMHFHFLFIFFLLQKKYPQKPEQSLSWLWLLCIFIVILAWLFYF